jgi:hypothetical protein
MTRSFAILLTPAFMAIAAIGLHSSAAFATMTPAADIRTVARAGQPAPGTTRNFGTFVTSPPSVNIHGDAAFRANYAHQGPEGIWAERGSQGLQPVALPGQAAPGAPGRTFDYMGESNPGTNAAVSSLVYNNAGQIAFRGTFTGGGYFNNDGLWLAQPNGTLEFIARSGSNVAGSSKSVVQFEHARMSLNQHGDVSFRGRYTTSFTNDAGLFRYRGPGTTQFLGETFDPVPGESPRLFKEYAFDGGLIDAAGRTFFIASPGTSTGAYTGDNGIYMHDGATLQRIVRDDEPIPGMSGLIFGGIPSFELAINSQGQYAFGAGLRGSAVTLQSNVGLFRGTAGAAIELVLREGLQAPGLPTGVQFESFGAPEINLHGQMAFIGILRGPGISTVNNESVWVETPAGEFRMLAQEGSQAPEAPAEVYFGHRSTPFPAFSELVLNAHGQVAFHASLNGTGLGSTAGNLNDDGVWATDAQGNLRSIVIAGQPFLTSEGSTQTHGTIIFAGGTGNDDGLASGFSDAGHVAFQGYFGNSPAIYVSSKVAIPEPSATALAALGLSVGLATGKRRR